MLMCVYYWAVNAAIQDVIEPSLRGTAMALYFFARCDGRGQQTARVYGYW